ncbi:MAG: TetR/AcrR family transcriptional regulator [Sulfitobacter sp.]
MGQKKSFHHGDLKRALLNATLKFIDTETVSGVTIRGVAKATGVSHAAPIKHYSDRRQLLTAAANVVFGEIVELTRQRLSASEQPVRERLITTAYVLYEYALEHPNRYEFIWRNDLVDHDNPDLLITMNRLYYGYNTQADESTLETGFDHDTLAVMIWSMVHGYADLRLKGMFEERQDQKTGQDRLPAMIDLMRNAFFKSS